MIIDPQEPMANNEGKHDGEIVHPELTTVTQEQVVCNLERNTIETSQPKLVPSNLNKKTAETFHPEITTVTQELVVQDFIKHSEGGLQKLKETTITQELVVGENGKHP